MLLLVIEEDAGKAQEKNPCLWLLRFRDSGRVRFLLQPELRGGDLRGLQISDLTLVERRGAALVRRGKGRKQRIGRFRDVDERNVRIDVLTSQERGK